MVFILYGFFGFLLFFPMNDSNWINLFYVYSKSSNFETSKKKIGANLTFQQYKLYHQKLHKAK